MNGHSANHPIGLPVVYNSVKQEDPARAAKFAVVFENADGTVQPKGVTVI
jgi:hypothetical protein